MAYVTVKDISEHTGITEDTIRRYVREDKIPHYRIGPKIIRLRLDEVEEWIKQGGFRADEQPEEQS